MPDKVQISPHTQTSLKTDLTLRCVIQTKYRDGKSRRSAAVIPWAQSLAERLSSTIIEEVGQQTTGFNTQLIMIQMLGSRENVYICYDLFLNECDRDLRAEISENIHLKRPIHVITRKNKVFIMRRDERVDTKVLQKYVSMRSSDKGPLPLFSDLKHPPVYQNGVRLIEWEELTERFPAWRKPGKDGPAKLNEEEGQEKPAQGDSRQD